MNREQQKAAVDSPRSCFGRSRPRLRALGVAGLLTASLAFAAAARAEVGRQPERDRAVILREVKELMRGGETDAASLRRAVFLLEEIDGPFDQDIRVPLWLAEAYYRMADPEADIAQVFPYFEKTGRYAKEALEIDPERPEAHYWYGLFLLRKAQHGPWFSAFSAVKGGIRELERVREAMPDYDHGGASRVLGLLYYTAPGWSPFGDTEKAVELEKEAAHIAPEYLLNRVYLARAYEKRGKTEQALREYRKIAASEPSTRRTEDRYREEARKVLLAHNQPIGARGTYAR